ncbi:glycosyltransferase [Halorubrum sp. GN12_10-3_MGM]|uniref:glycosyltransferase n=1 Tax=Halorubrum sp. GN12_10-3_MGM TaxID=2518113 RepID=UPI0010F75892|nr:glycosyltransferase [Halorubrum sp. GN12_10-3_MGM]TKX61416.1 colanic acid biosynthesis glycosyltransferase WcaL [Halorubrum sp. GN12_10-3_MGM]
MKIAHLTSVFPKVSETFILNQIAGLIDAGHDVDIFAHSSGESGVNHPIVDEYDLLEKTTYTNAPTDYRQGALRFLSSVIRAPKRTPQILKSLQFGHRARIRVSFLDTVPAGYDLYHAHFGWEAEMSDFIPHVLNAPLIVSFYGNDAGAFLKEDPSRYDHLWPEVAAISVLSYDMKEKLVNSGAPEQKVVINPLSANLQNFEFSPTHKSSPLKIATVARFTEKKGLRYAIRAISKVIDQVDVEYKIAGDGDQRDEIEDLITSEGISDSVNLLGWADQSEIDELLTESHLFLLPSHTARDGDREGTPTVLLEAQASGLPIISTYHAGIPEIVEDRRRGYLCPVMDVDSIAEAILELWDRSDEWETMSERGRSYVEETHSREAQTERLERIYQEVI